MGGGPTVVINAWEEEGEERETKRDLHPTNAATRTTIDSSSSGVSRSCGGGVRDGDVNLHFDRPVEHSCRSDISTTGSIRLQSKHMSFNNSVTQF